MSQKIQISLDFAQDLEQYLAQHYPEKRLARILSKSLDARGSNRGKRPQYLYQLLLLDINEQIEQTQQQFSQIKNAKHTPIIIGAGPAGLFCALMLSEYGIKSIILERGSSAHERMKKIAKFWRYGQLDPDDNVCFGEGGAGLFSDGKLITRIKSAHISYVMQKLVDFGAPAETAYLANPHLGSNRIRAIISTLATYLKSKGHIIRYNTKVTQLMFEEKSGKKQVTGIGLADGSMLHSPSVFLATGHSAHDIYDELKKHQVAMEAKDFAIGVRMEHPRALIDKIQHGQFCTSPELGAARYRLSWHDEYVERGSYSFCMCPGGYVLSSGTDSDGIVTNGMSNYARSSPWSNAALVVSIKNKIDFDASKNVLAGLDYQRQVEKKAFLFSRKNKSGREIPAQRLDQFLAAARPGPILPKSSCPSGTVPANLDELLPTVVSHQLRLALEKFNRQMPGIISQDGLLLAPETRTSAPITVLRSHDELTSPGHDGLYPCGEGAGHAGGITSAAVDGIKAAIAYVKKHHPDCI